MAKKTNTNTNTNTTNTTTTNEVVNLINKVSAVALVGKAGAAKARDLHKELVDTISASFDLTNEGKAVDAIKAVYSRLPEYDSPARRQTAIRSIERAFSKAISSSLGEKADVKIRERATSKAEKGITLSLKSAKEVKEEKIMKAAAALAKVLKGESESLVFDIMNLVYAEIIGTAEKAKVNEDTTTAADNAAISEGLKIAGLA